jgi:hypothetical protein
MVEETKVCGIHMKNDDGKEEFVVDGIRFVPEYSAKEELLEVPKEVEICQFDICGEFVRRISKKQGLTCNSNWWGIIFWHNYSVSVSKGHSNLASEQKFELQPVLKKDLKAGDLIFYSYEDEKFDVAKYPYRYCFWLGHEINRIVTATGPENGLRIEEKELPEGVLLFLVVQKGKFNKRKK